MKIRKIKSLLYIFSSVMVLGLALLSFDSMGPEQQTVQLPSPTPVENTGKPATPSPAPTKQPHHTATPSPSPTPTSTPTPTPTPSLAELNAAIAIQPATDEIGTSLTATVTDYLNKFYSAEEKQVKEISNITCYYKKGLANVDYIVYASYDIVYKQSNVPVPTLEEFCISVEGDVATVYTEPEEEEVREALYLSRASESVSTLYIQELIRRYMNAKLACDETLLSSMVTDSSYLNMDNIRQKTEYIEEYRNLKLMLRVCPDEITEFDYIAYAAYDSKIISISTPAASIDEYIITLDENNYPKVFYGVTSKTADDFRVASMQQEDYQLFREENAVKPLADAMLLDPDLMEFMGRIFNATEEENQTQESENE